MYVKEYIFCRICDTNIQEEESFLNLELQSIQGALWTPKKPLVPTRKVLHEIVKCPSCNLIQNRRSVDPDILYSSYFYRSSISDTMKNHLKSITKNASQTVSKDKYEVLNVLDIAANDFTLLKFYSEHYNKVAIDPSDISLEASKENPEITLINDCFPSPKLYSEKGQIEFNIITSIACFYDINDPVKFAIEIKKLLSENGIWICEFAYLPLVLERLSYDGLVHEHVTLYSLQTFEEVLSRAGLKAIKAIKNDVNGGSLQVWITHEKCSCYEKFGKKELTQIKVEEFNANLEGDDIYENFTQRVENHRKELIDVLFKLKNNNEKIHILGLSTKLNNILQYCDLGPSVFECASERDPEKFGGKTLSGIPIVPEEESRKTATVYLVGPYHFKNEILKREKKFIMNGGKLLFPLPEITLVTKENYEQHLT